MAELSMEDVGRLGNEAAKEAIEYIMCCVADPLTPTEDERKMVVVLFAICIAAMNTHLLMNCPPEVYKESQDLILQFMEAKSQAIQAHVRSKLPPEGEE
jgi:hypothetical protein